MEGYHSRGDHLAREGEKTRKFRGVLERLMLIQEALEEAGVPEEKRPFHSWQESGDENGASWLKGSISRFPNGYQ